MKLNFKKNFVFGASLSGPQTEGYSGKKNESNWDWWYKDNSEDFYQNTGPLKLHDLNNRYEEYVSIMKKQKLNSIRTSIQWTRIINDYDNNEINEEGINFYKKYFNLIKEAGIKLHICLHHFDMPRKLENRGGWLSNSVIEKFVKFAEICFKEFDQYADLWIVFNEPLVICDSAYVYGYHQPLINDFQKSMQAAVNIMYATARVIQVYKENNFNKKIGLALNLTPAYPIDSNSESDVLAAKYEKIITNDIFMYPAIKGEIQPAFLDLMNKGGIKLNISEEYVNTIKHNTISFLGVNYYAPVRVSGKNISGKPKSRDHYFVQQKHPDSIINEHRGWEIYGKGLYDIAQWIKEEYDNIDWMVQENGLGIGNEEEFIENNVVNDEYRIDFYKEHLFWLDKAIAEGANCFGYNVWTFVDNWSWLNAFKNRYGLWRYDLNTMEFSQKKSGKWFTLLSESKELEIGDEKVLNFLEHVKKF